MKPEYIRHVDMECTRYGESAVMTGIENLKGTYKGRPGEMALRFSNTLVRRDGRWQLVAHQSTRVEVDNMKLILTGATGFAGGEVLKQALADPPSSA